jgi:glycosyltransferase involved in cell wall biosynthesis
LRIINNGIDIDTFYPVSSCAGIRRKHGIFDKYMLLGVASTWDRRKGLDDYLKLSGILSSEYVIVLVGLSKRQLKDLPPNIIGIERTESINELAELYSAADIVLNLSSMETFGMTTVEGFACGTPGIVYNSTASPELITPETGLIVEPGNIGELVIAIGKIRSNKKNYYKTSCRMRAESLYRKENKCDEYMSLYKDLLT